MIDQSRQSDELRSVFIDHARNYLSHDYLPKIERCLDQLNDEQIWWRPNTGSNSIGNLVLHLCGNLRQWILSGLGGAADDRVRQAEFDQRAIIPRSELVSRLRETLKAVDEVLEDFDRGRLLDRFQIQGNMVTAIEAIFHVTEHFSMHTGQIILVTKTLVEADLNFYDFSSGVPVHTWNKVKTE
jgi:uncharacterized damage-inducible protein DinB